MLYRWLLFASLKVNWVLIGVQVNCYCSFSVGFVHVYARDVTECKFNIMITVTKIIMVVGIIAVLLTCAENV